jgi:hypothetical protein
VVTISSNEPISDFRVSSRQIAFLNCIKKLDIVGLVETHTTSSFISPLDDYKIFHTHRVQNNRAKRSSRTRIFSHRVLRDIEHFIDISS